MRDSLMQSPVCPARLRPHRRFGLAACVCFAGLAVACATALAQPSDVAEPVEAPAPEAKPAEARPNFRFYLITGTLEARPTRTITGIAADRISYADERGLPATIATPEALALVPAAWWNLQSTAPGMSQSTTVDLRATPSNDPRRALLELTDGSRLFGRPATGALVDGAVLWWHPVLEGIAFKLDNVRSLWPRGVGSAPATEDSGAVGTDVVLLANGDKLTGFVASIAPPAGADARTPEVTIERDSAKTVVPLDRVSRISLNNPPAGPPPVRVWLADGSIIPAESLTQADPTSLRLRIMRQPGAVSEAKVAINEIRAIAFAAPGVVPLAHLAPLAQKPSADRRWSRPVSVSDEPAAPLGAADIELPGPMTVRWELPKGAKRIGGTLLLPDECRVWGDCVVVLTMQSGEGEAVALAREPLNAGRPAAPISVVLPESAKPATLNITVEQGPAGYGPIQDRVVLRRMVIVK